MFDVEILIYNHMSYLTTLDEPLFHFECKCDAADDFGISSVDNLIDHGFMIMSAIWLDLFSLH